ncbi:MAG: hypothetical protein HOV80_03600 [Polyangiaceae bacterium]|nr:hypothetical protein [Polyangiaceae bacterium]
MKLKHTVLLLLLLGCSPNKKAMSPESDPAAAETKSKGAEPGEVEEQAPDFAAIFGTDVDTTNIDLVPGVLDRMTRDDVAKVHPAVKGTKGDVELDIKHPGIASVELGFLKDEVWRVQLRFTEKASTPEAWTALVKAMETKFGPPPAGVDRNGDKIAWGTASDPEVKKGSKGFEVSAPLDRASGKAKPFDVDAFLGDAKGKVPAFFAAYKRSTPKDDALAELGKAGALGSVEHFGNEGAHVYSREGGQYRVVTFTYAEKTSELKKIAVELHASESSRERFLALRDAFAKKLGAPTKRQPATASDAEATWFFWGDKVRMRYVSTRIAIEYLP